MIEVEHDLGRARLRGSDNTLERFADLLPIEDASLLRRSFLPPTPCVHARSLGRRLGLDRLFLKNETALPTGTTKDRMAAVALPYLVERGVAVFCTSSTGNSSTAFAHAIDRFPELELCLFTAEDWQRRVDYGSSGRVTAFVLRGATFVDAFELAGAFARRHGLTAERGFFNPGRREGLKLAFCEAVEQLGRPIDWYVQAVSSAMGLVGTLKGARELRALGLTDRLPRLLGVQQATCAPMVHAWQDRCATLEPRHVVARPRGIAEAILRGDPTRAYPYVYRAIVESRGDLVSVDEAQIREARRLIADDEGIDACHNAAAALAGLALEVRAGRVGSDQTVLVNLTGRDRGPCEPTCPVHRLVADGAGWSPAEPADAAHAAWSAGGGEGVRRVVAFAD